MATVRENLIAAKALIDTPEKWGKGDYAIGDCFCALGAARKACFGTVYGKANDANPVAIELKLALEPKWHRSVDEFNDDRKTTHADVMALFDRAIAAQDGAP